MASWVAEVDNRVVGHVALHCESHPRAMETVRVSGITGELGVVARLMVDPSARRRGLGALLLEHARGDAVARGRVPVLDVVASATPAINLYVEQGWKERLDLWNLYPLLIHLNLFGLGYLKRIDTIVSDFT